LSEKGIFVGYNEVSKAYTVCIPKNRRVIVIQDVRFKEDRTFRRLHDIEPVGVEY